MIELDNRFDLSTEFQAMAEQVLAAAKAKGATAAELDIDKSMGLSVEVRMGQVEKLQYHRDQGINLAVYFGHRKGYASTGDFSPQALADTLEAACRIARYTSEDDFNGLADAERMATEFPKLDLYHPWELNADMAIDMALQTEAVAREHDARITNSEGAGVDSYAGMSLYANSHGFMGVSHSTRHSLSCSVVAQDGDSMQRDYWYSVSRVPGLLESADSVGAEAAQRTVRRLNARSLSTREAPVLFVPQMARGLVGQLVSAISGGSQYRKASFLLNSIGQQAFPDFVQLREDPLIRQALGSRSYDAEGVATQARDIVKDGIIQGYFLGSYSARKLGMQSTGSASGATNLLLADTGVSFPDLLAQMGTGLMVTELIGSGVNGITGDYSRGAVGYWVENGMIVHPVEEVTIAGNLKAMFKGIVAIGDDVDARGSIRTGSILIDKMTIAGQ
ncbi:metalloprotease PmbA [Thiothrix subterranea]|uniref:Metalloprotease PmbA n=1 Tax=Thiothrix subterranea TaxID=2735563 RepID=A0AA51R319_9GAMM|nr:metalloprotease PmbA [Thiothrix subterranea]MDQ5770408.1 metalloprotease PmbA [Thiothrix subterranea]WML85115.1 metalloprotease PmbA [Thiothrix subterranea]